MGGFLSGRTSLTTVQTADIAADAITLAKMAAGTDGNIISYDASGNPVAIATGDDGQALHSAGAGAPPAFETVSAGFTLATEQATTSGTDITFSSIPSGTKQIHVIFYGVSTSDTSAGNAIFVQIGDSGGIETSSYVSEGSSLDAAYMYSVTDTAGFSVYTVHYITAANEIINGVLSLYLEDASNFTWISSGTFMQQTANANDGFMSTAGSKSLSAELTQLKVLHEASATFDAGAINIMYM